MPDTGDVFYGRYTFADGGSSMKFIIVVYSNEESDQVVSCIVTKVTTEKNSTAGCHPKTQRFLIPENNEGFSKDTYLELLRFKEWGYSDFMQNISEKSIEFNKTLSSATIAAIKECYKKLKYDIPASLFPLVTT